MIVKFFALLGAASLVVTVVKSIAKHWVPSDRLKFVRLLTAETEYPDEDEVSAERQHINPPWDCWCGAEEILQGIEGQFLPVWVHKGPGDEPASPRAIAQAVSDALAGRFDR